MQRFVDIHNQLLNLIYVHDQLLDLDECLGQTPLFGYHLQPESSKEDTKLGPSTEDPQLGLSREDP